MDKPSKVVYSKDDQSNIKTFFEYFKTKIPPELAAHMEKFNNNAEEFTLKDQEELTADLCKALLDCQHDLKNDEVWKPIEELLSDYWYSAKFDRDVKKIIEED